MDKYKFGDFIYHKRKEKGLTQEELGRKLGVQIKQFQNGKSEKQCQTLLC